MNDDSLVSELYAGAKELQEETDVTFGLNPDYANAIEEAGLRPAVVEAQGGRPYLHVLEDRPFHLTVAYLPQLASSPDNPHPRFEGLLAAALAQGA